MIVIAGFILGALLGALSARRRNGSRMDMLQYAVIYGLILAIIGLFVTVVVERSL